MLFNSQSLRDYCLEGKKPCLLDPDENRAKAAEFKEFRARIPVEDEEIGGMVTGSVDKPLDYDSFVERLCELSSNQETRNCLKDIPSQDSNFGNIQPIDTMKTTNGTSKPSQGNAIASSYLQSSTIASSSSGIANTTHRNFGSSAVASNSSFGTVLSHPIDSTAASSGSSAAATPAAGSTGRKVLTFKKSGLTENAEIQNFFQSLLNKKKSEF